MVLTRRVDRSAEPTQAVRDSASIADDERPGSAAGLEWVAGLQRGILMTCAVLAMTLPPAQLANRVVSAPESGRATSSHMLQIPRHADFPGVAASADARFIANWVTDSRDNGKLSFVFIDKKCTGFCI